MKLNPALKTSVMCRLPSAGEYSMSIPSSVPGSNGWGGRLHTSSFSSQNSAFGFDAITVCVLRS